VIRKEEILERARSWGLRVDVVEKDYVLGWLLAALARNPNVKRDWVFKGGTCLKKCYFETYRFSEDLDFSIRPGATYTSDAILGMLNGPTCWATSCPPSPRSMLFSTGSTQCSRGSTGRSIDHRAPRHILGSQVWDVSLREA
jgi:hypothetical protein